MNLFRNQVLKLLKEISELNSRGVMIRIIGEIELLPPNVRQPAAELEFKTRQNKKYILNICFAYTSRLELLSASKKLLEATNIKSSLNVEDIDERLVKRSLYLSSNPQLVIRTSGEVRLSDFLLFQVN
jgi:ditrans,polycis-polyprenyl diphosphate synthase